MLFDRRSIMLRAVAEARWARVTGSSEPWQALMRSALGRSWLRAKLSIVAEGRAPTNAPPPRALVRKLSHLRRRRESYREARAPEVRGVRC
jgi:hypothetical protein